MEFSIKIKLKIKYQCYFLSTYDFKNDQVFSKKIYNIIQHLQEHVLEGR